MAEVVRALGGRELAEGGTDGVAQRVRGPGGGGAEQALELAEGEFDCVSMLPLYAGFLLRPGVGGSVLIRSNSPALIRTSQMRCPPRAAKRPRRRPSRSHR